MKIGILGGSFNPAHSGHLHISLLALKKLQLDQIWWVVSPQNPLKKNIKTPDLNERINFAKQIATHPKIKITDIEKKFFGENQKNYFTLNFLKRLKQKFPQHDFVWVMGSDNLTNFHKWHKWLEVCKTIEVKVFERPGFKFGNLSLPQSKKIGRENIFRGKLEKTSSTKIRNS
jgi:nicotinate-nucleotide adenylyltransferase